MNTEAMAVPTFKEFPKIARLNRECIIACLLLALAAGCGPEESQPRMIVRVQPDTSLIGTRAVIVDAGPRDILIRIPADRTISGDPNGIQVISSAAALYRIR